MLPILLAIVFVLSNILWYYNWKDFDKLDVLVILETEGEFRELTHPETRTLQTKITLFLIGVLGAGISGVHLFF